MGLLRKVKEELLPLICSIVAVVVIGLGSSALAADLTVDDTDDSGNTTDTTVVTRTASDDDFTVTTATDNTAVNHGTGTITLSGGTNDILITKLDADNNSAVTVKVNGNIVNNTGSLAVTILEAADGNNNTISLQVTGTTLVTTTTTVSTTGATQAGNTHTATLTLDGNATLTGAVSVTAAAAGNAGSTAQITFGGQTNATGAITLNDNANNAKAKLLFNHSAAASTHSGTIDGAAAEEGTVTVNTGATNAITFASNIGATQELHALVVGDATAAGNAVFTGNVEAETITMLANEGDSSIDFNGNLEIGGGHLTADGGDGAGEDITINIFGNVTTETANNDSILLDNNSGAVTLTFDGSAAQQIDAKIEGVGSAEGTINIANSAAAGITFEEDVGGDQAVAAIVVGSADGTNTTATFTEAFGATAITIGNAGSTTDTHSMIVDSADGTIAAAGTVEGTTDTESLNIYDTSGGGAGNAVTFSGTVGNTTPIDTIAIGTTDHEGAAVFSNTVKATTMTLTAGGAAAETATASFASGKTATITNITLTGGGVNANQDATLTVTDAIVAATTISLDDATGQAAIDVNTASARAFSGTIDGGAAGEGTLTVDDSDDNGAPDAVTFANNVGATNSLLLVQVGADNATAGAAVFSGSLAATTITVNSGEDNAENSELTATGAITATTVNVVATTADNSATATLDANSSVTAATINITGGTANAGADASLEAFGNVTATTEIQLDDNTGGTGGALLVTNGTAAQTITGTINGQGNGDGRIQNSNTAATVTFTGTIGATNTIEDIIIDAGADTTFQGTAALTGDFTIAAGTATTTIGGTVAVGDKLTIGGTGNTIAVASTLGAGDTVFTSVSGGTAITDNDATADVTVTLPSNFTSGTLTFINDGSAQTNFADEFAITDNALTDFTMQVNGGDATILEITAAAKSASAAAAELGVSEDAAVATQNAAIAFNGDATLRDLLTTALTTGGTTASEAAETLQGSPAAITSAGSAAVTATGTQVIAVGSSRLASLRTGTAFASAQAAGFAAGQDVLSKAVWFKPFVNFADQTRRKGIAGFDTETFGGAIGGDLKIGDSTVGMSFSYANTDVDSKGTENAQTDIDSYQATMYADYTTSTYYVEALIGYARNEISTSRTLTINNSTAIADYGSNQYMVNIGGGMPVEVEEGHFITPTASFQYTLVDNETYTETGAGVANLRVAQDEVHQALGIVGAKYHSNQSLDSGTFTPELHAALTYDFAGDDGVSTNVFNGGGAQFQVTGADVVEFGQQIGAGVSFMPLAAQGLTISANYDFWNRENFQSHSANFQLRMEF
ncbi:autotransporter outer membrane beta-barrel domain-containing protein [Nitrospinae bacterium]|nr:autotransporter outer membrane beta-barrel domain-containing protein [Nitrospinota bacterium]